MAYEESERKINRTITIEVYEGNYLDVREGDRYCDGLSWDEALGTVAELTHHRIGECRYRMLTKEEWVADAKRREERRAERHTPIKENP